MFRATMCPSSGADDCVMLQPCVGMCRGCTKVVKSGWQVVRPQDALPTNRTFAQNCTALSRLYILSSLCHYCPVTAPLFWCRSIRFDYIANATDIQRFCKTRHRVFGVDRCTATDITGVALQQSPNRCCSTSGE